MTALSKVISCRAAKGEVRTWPARERQSMRLPGRCRPVPQDAPDGGARVLVGLAVFKTADGPHGSWWVRFPLPSATLPLDYHGLPLDTPRLSWECIYSAPPSPRFPSAFPSIPSWERCGSDRRASSGHRGFSPGSTVGMKDLDGLGRISGWRWQVIASHFCHSLPPAPHQGFPTGPGHRTPPEGSQKIGLDASLTRPLGFITLP